ncbi:MAG: glycoside hydrolase family 5 protein [Oscillospiraceae bacterium]|nr:glycoside hydrolase family 5 protein [Oscillospiraceae bacterium]
MKMKRLQRAALFTAVTFALICSGCGTATAGQSEAETSVTEVTVPDVTIPENVLEDAEMSIPDVTVDKYKVPETEGTAFIRQLKLGWNLGNTFDAIDVSGITMENELNYEKSWCSEFTTIENIAAIKAAGFETIRIPVSWHNHMDESYQISEAWMSRVKEVVDWARACDMYVILNTHHDNSEAYYYPDEEHMEQSRQYLTAVWKQIAENFRDYDEHLILESMNEPRLVGHANEWWLDMNQADCRESVECINQLNQLFVDTIRSAGGENANRWLLCPGYDASCDGAVNDSFVLPTDPKNRVIVSVHAYTPYEFALNTKGTEEWSLDNTADQNEILSFMDKLYGKYVMNGIPVLIGEFGALNKDNLENRVAFSVFYTKAARARGISCCWWDNNAFSGSGENFGLLYRKTSTFPYPEIVQALVKGSEVE